MKPDVLLLSVKRTKCIPTISQAQALPSPEHPGTLVLTSACAKIFASRTTVMLLLKQDSIPSKSLTSPLGRMANPNSCEVQQMNLDYSSILIGMNHVTQ